MKIQIQGKIEKDIPCFCCNEGKEWKADLLVMGSQNIHKYLCAGCYWQIQQTIRRIKRKANKKT